MQINSSSKVMFIKKVFTPSSLEVQKKTLQILSFPNKFLPKVRELFVTPPEKVQREDNRRTLM